MKVYELHVPTSDDPNEDTVIWIASKAKPLIRCKEIISAIKETDLPTDALGIDLVIN